MQLSPRHARRPKLSDLIVEDVKRWIVTQRKQPGDKLPSEKELVEQFGVDKSTVREALKALEVRGLIRTRTGPGGGATLQQVSFDHVSEPLRNFLHFHHLDGHHIYQLRKVLEPELAVSVVGLLGPETMAQLAENISLCEHQPVDEEEMKAQRVAELEFHNLLVQHCPNPILAFVCRFLNDLLRDLMVYKNAIDHRHFGKANVDFHRKLLTAFKKKDAAKVRKLMTAHMIDAESHMHEMEAHVGVGQLMQSTERR